jgi:molybdopterin converting factor small subunit
VADVNDVASRFAVTVRYFAAARSAAGVEDEVVTMPAGATVATLADSLAARSTGLARMLQRCSYLCDGAAVRNPHTALSEGQTIDVLPPFAGG